MPRKRRVPGQAPDPRGGVRQGSPGRAYPNRTDMNAQAVKTTTGQAYGQAGQQAAAQRAVPLAQTPPVPTGGPPAAPGGAWSYPEDVPNLTDPTGRPDEPITAGLPFGPGAGPMANRRPSVDPVSDELRALYLRFPTQELLELIEMQELS